MIDKKALSGNIWKYYLYQFFSGFFLIEAIVVLFYMLSGIDYFELSLVLVVGYSTVLLFEVPSGALADMLGRKKTMFFGLFLTGIEIILIAFGFNLLFFLLASFIGAIGTTLISGSDTALLYDSLKPLKREKEFKKIYGKGRSLLFLSVVVAGPIGAFIYAINRPLVFYLNGAIFIFGSFIALTIYEPKKQRGKYSFSKHLDHIKKSFVYTINHKKLRWILTFSVFSGAFISVFHNMLRQPYMKSIGIDIAIFGVLTSILFLARSAVSYISHDLEKKLGEKRSLYLIVILQSLTFIAMAFVDIYVAFIFILFIYSIWTYQEVIMEDYSNHHMNSKQRATLISIYQFFRSSVLVVSFLLVGFLVDLTSISVSLYVLAGLSLFFGLALLLTRK